MKSRWLAGALCLGIGLWLVSLAMAGTSDVFRANGTIQGLIDFNFLIDHKVQIDRNDLINLARDRNLGSEVPPNEVLALTSVCVTDDFKLIVFDTSTMSNLVTIGQLDVVDKVGGVGKEELIAHFTVHGTGGQSNALTGGTLLMDAKIILDKTNCMTKWTGTLLGVLGTLVPATNFTSVPMTNTLVIVTTNITCCATNIVNNMTNVACCVTNTMNNMTNITCCSSTNVVETMTNLVTFTIQTNVGPMNINVLVPNAKFSTSGKKIGTLIEGP